MVKYNKEYIEEIIDEYLNEGDISVEEFEKNQIIETLINCDYSKAEKGGIVALRGFVYQYLVTVYYMLNIVKKKIDWDYVIYELGDDVALVKKNKICFCQVKTKMDADEVINFNIKTDLVKRKKKLDSWIDKLFLNSKRIEDKMNKVGVSSDEPIEASFNLVINTWYNSMSEIAPYCEGSKLKDKDKVIESCLKEIKVYEGVKYSLEDELDNSIEWYMQKFNIVPLGGYKSLFNQNIALVCEIIDDSDLEVGKKIVEELITHILFNTHNDYLVNKDEKLKFIFRKDEFIQIIRDKEQLVRQQIEITRQKRVLNKMFENAFLAIKQEFERQYESILLDELTKSMLWLRDSLLEKVIQDEYVYEKFISRIFLLENYKSSCLDPSNPLDMTDLINSLKNIIIYMIFYSDRNIINGQDAKFLIKSGINNDIKTYLTTYNVRKGKSELEAISYIYSNMKKCPELKALTGEIICFLLDYKESIFDEWDIECDHNIIGNNDEFKVVSKPKNIKICKINELNKYPESIQMRIKRNIIKNDCVFSRAPVWEQYLSKYLKE